MPKKRYTPEEIVAKLRQVDVVVSQGQNIADAIRQIGVREVTYYRWRQEYGGLKADQVKRLKELEQENSRLGRAVSDLTLDKLILHAHSDEVARAFRDDVARCSDMMSPRGSGASLADDFLHSVAGRSILGCLGVT
jgi:putative transposase